MPSKTVTATSPYKRHRTATPGLTYRLRADGKTRTYYASAGDGRHVRCGSYDEAKETLEGIAAAKRQGVKPVINSKVTFSMLAEQWYEVKVSRVRERTRRYYRDALDLVLLPRFGTWLVSAIDADAIAHLVRDLEREGLHAIDKKRVPRPLGQSSIQNYLKPLGGPAKKRKGILDMAVRRRLILLNPMDVLTDDDRPVPSEHKPDYEWTKDELASLVASAEANAAKPTAKYNYGPLLIVAAGLGLRLGEVLGLQWQDFDYETGMLKVQRQWTVYGSYGPPKTKAGIRTLYLPDGVRELLRGVWVVSEYVDETDPIFASKAGKPLAHRNVTQRGFEKARDAAGLDKSLTFHQLRHAAASRLIASGLDDELIADQLGHGDTTVTRRIYSHVFDREKKADAIRKAHTV